MLMHPSCRGMVHMAVSKPSSHHGSLLSLFYSNTSKGSGLLTSLLYLQALRHVGVLEDGMTWGRNRLGTAMRCNGNDTIGNSDLHVSSLCLGCMQFGEGISEEDAIKILNEAAEGGINFFDVAEMYPVPQRAETQGRSETILGRWRKSSIWREDVVVATKVAGPADMPWLREGPMRIDARNILEAIEGSLRRLQVDYIDLLQIHWPDRYVPMFGEVEYDPRLSYSSVPIEEQLEAIFKAIQAGKIRYFGLSNETPWGLLRFLHAAQQMDSTKRSLSKTPPSSSYTDGDIIKAFNTFETHHRTFSSNDIQWSSSLRPISIQNAYSLMCRTFECGLAECCHRENVSLLAYSPLAMGLLTGKYLAADGGPPEARLNKYRGRYAEAESRYGPKPNVLEATQAYADLAKKNGLSPVELALRFVLSNPLVCGAVIGVTSIEQLQELMAAAQAPVLDDELLAAVDGVHHRYPNPTP